MAGLRELQSLETKASLILGWKEDLLTGSKDIADNGCISKLEEFSAVPPSSKGLGVGIFVCMAAEILLRDVQAANVSQILTDAKQLMGNFLSNTLKINKASIPKAVTALLEKLTKDWQRGCVLVQVHFKKFRTV